MSLLTDHLDRSCIKYDEKFDVSACSSIKIGGIADIVVLPKNEGELINTVNFLYDNRFNYKVVGGLTNILFAHEKITDVLIKTDNMCGISYDGHLFSLRGGERISKYARMWAEDGFGGYEGLVGIPGSIGGMLNSNAGAFGDEMGDIVRSASVYDPSQRKKIRIDKSEMRLAYRNSCFKGSDLIILSVDLLLKHANKEEVLKKMTHYRNARKKSQPNLPSLGSIFKRPYNGYASRLIDISGLKGYRIGGASISEKHAGFIVNHGGASADDVLKLIDVAKSAVKSKFGILLEEEIEIM